MKQKKVFLLLVLFSFLLFSLCVVNAQTSEEEKINNAYNWLVQQVHGKWDTLNTKQNVFSLLALQCNSTFFNPGNESLYDKSFLYKGQRCWGVDDVSSQGQCKLTETALAKIALDEFGYETEEAAQWLISRNKTFLDIHWYLQIDIEQGQQANCSIIYNGKEEQGYRIYKDKSVAILGSSECFSAASYWFKVKQTEECYNSQYTVKCWSGSSYYVVSWLYKKSPTSNIFYVSDETQSASPGYGTVEPDSIDTELTSYCLTNPSDSATCSYEGTGWASYALAKQGNLEDANTYIPYLIVAQESNIQYFPYTFLYQLMKTVIYETKIENEQKTAGYWLIQPIVYGRNYDTAHAAMALGLGNEASQIAKEWLLSSQTSTGFWDTVDPGKERIRDTAFILWIFWPDFCPTGEGGVSGDCEDQGPEFTCRDSCEVDEIIIPLFDCGGTDICCKKVGTGGADCISEGGTCKDECNSYEYELVGEDCGTEKCCKAYIDMTCDEVGGDFCTGGMMCDGDEVETSDSLLELCCLGNCVTGATCEAQDGVECDPPKYCPSSRQIAASNTDYCCEQGYCESASNLRCSLDLGGELCTSGEVCIDYSRNIISFVNSLDGNCCIDGSCVKNQYCSDLNGKECGYLEQCDENVYVETLDTDDCCTSECLAYCEDEGGVYCDTGEQCDGGQFIKSIEGPSCCIQGNCKGAGAGFPWWIIIIIVVVLAGGAAAYFLYFRKPKKPKTKPGFPFGPGPGPRPGPGIRPMMRPMPRRPISRPPQRIPAANVLKKPNIMMPSVPRPAEKRPVGAPERIMRKIEKPSSFVSKPVRPMRRHIRPKAKSKTESDLEKTLSKLRKITKKKTSSKSKKSVAKKK